MKTFITFFAAVVMALTLCARAYAQSVPEEYLRVRIFLYSGIPDPEFKITDPQVIAKLLADE